MYLDQSRRHDLDAGVVSPASALDVAYELTKTVLNAWELRETYANYLTVLGALDDVKDEFRRRIGIPLLERRKNTYGDTFNGADVDEVPF